MTDESTLDRLERLLADRVRFEEIAADYCDDPIEVTDAQDAISSIDGEIEKVAGSAAPALIAAARALEGITPVINDLENWGAVLKLSCRYDEAAVVGDWVGRLVAAQAALEALDK